MPLAQPVGIRFDLQALCAAGGARNLDLKQAATGGPSWKEQTHVERGQIRAEAPLAGLVDLQEAIEVSPLLQRDQGSYGNYFGRRL